MPLRFYVGASGAGKSTALYREIIARSEKEPDRNFLVIVPDQFTMQTQKDLVCMHPRRGIMNIDVLSFGRLSHRIAEETGQDNRTVLDDTGKSLVLRKLAGRLSGELTVIGGNLNKPGYIHEVKSAISEFMQYGIDEKKLGELTDYARKRGGLYHRLKDLGVLYQAFRSYTEEKFVTTEETMEQLARRIPVSVLVKGAVVAIDGFTGFTPVQNQVLRALMETAAEVIVSVEVDGRENLYSAGGEQDLFHLSKKTLASLSLLAREAGVERGEDVVLTARPVPRFRNNPSLACLEQGLFRYPIRPYEGEAAIEIMEASSQREEVRQVCIAIRRYLRRTGGCYRDVAIIAGNLADYAGFLETEAEVYGIPLYLDRTRGIVLNPFIEYIKGALQIIVQNFSYETVFHYIRSGLADFEPGEADRLENYVLSLGIRGKRKWQTLFTVRTKELEEPEEELAALNDSRRKLLDQLAPLSEKFENTRQLVLALYGFIEKNQVQRKLKAYENRFALEQDAVRQREYAQIYRLVMDLLDQIVELIGDEPVRMDEFARLLEAGFSEIQVGTIPQNVDRVVAGDMERTRLKQVKALFFLGVNDGYIPRPASGGGIISDLDREFLSGSGTELAPTPRQQMYIQRLYLYMNMTKPSDRLYLSYARMNGEGKAMRPAYLIDIVRQMFPSVAVSRPEEEPEIDQVQSLEDGRAFLVQGLRRFADGRMEEAAEREREFSQLYRIYAAAGQTAAWTGRMKEAAFTSFSAHPLDRAAALALFGTTLQTGISRLERYASCAYAHFLQYGLCLKERGDYSFEAVDLGNMFHGVLEIFGKKLRQRDFSWLDFPEKEGEALVEEAVESYAAAYGDSVLYDTARNRYMIIRLKRILKRTVVTLRYQLGKGVFRPEHFEVSFSAQDGPDGVSIDLTEREKLRLRGRIDRVDTWEEREGGDHRIYVKVVDYKSGSRDFSLAALYYGLQLQLVVYMNAAMEMERKSQGDCEVIPAAMLYYRVHDPLVESEGQASEEEIREKIRASLRMTGVVNGEEKIVDALDRGFVGKSDVIPVEKKKDGTFSARSNILSGGDFGVLSDYVNLKIREIGSRILEGRIAHNPCTGAGQDACAFCPYERVCGFDRKIPGFEKRELEKLEEREAMERMRRTVTEQKEPGDAAPGVSL